MTYRFLGNLLEEGREILPALVIDADGLKMISSLRNWEEWIPNNAVLTPHPGEMAVMTGETAAEINRNRVEMAETFARKWSHVVVLKGAFTVIAAPNGNTAIIPIATPALARAGTGDVLAGLIGGFLAQGLDAFDAAVAGAWVHAQAGLQALTDFGNSASILAGDVLDSIRGVMTKLNSDRV
jgi:NAD(P)H-hydrate epimerase